VPISIPAQAAGSRTHAGAHRARATDSGPLPPARHGQNGRPIALSRKNALFAGSDQGGVHWGVIASLIETCKLNAIDPQAYLASTLTRLINRHPASQIDQLMPWAYANPVV
jgi:IS66 C-terminal element